MAISDDRNSNRAIVPEGDSWKQALSEQIAPALSLLGSGLECMLIIYLYPQGTSRAKSGQ